MPAVPEQMKPNGQPRIPACTRSPKPCSGSAGSLTGVAQMSPLYLFSAGNNSKPLTGVGVLQRDVTLFPISHPALGSTSDVQHMPEDSLFSSRTQWSLFRSKNELTSVLPLVSAVISCALEEPSAKKKSSFYFELIFRYFNCLLQHTSMTSVF